MAARQAALSGQFELARDFALALRKADPDDREALIVLSAVQPQLSEPRAGRKAGARAYRLSDTDGERYEAARLIALAAANEERYTLSQVWLRRAAVNAPDARAYQQTQSDYRGIRNLNPWSINLGFSITPSNNLNGGTEEEFNIIDGITYADGSPVIGLFSGAARALPGTSVVADARLSYVVARTADHSTKMTARAYNRSVWLSAEGRELAPDSRNSDFASQLLELSLDHARAVGDGTMTAQALVGAAWFGGELSSEYLRGRLGYGRSVGERTRVTVTGTLDEVHLGTATSRTNHGRTISAAMTHVTADGNRVSGSLSLAGQSSQQPNERYETVTAQVSYSWADALGPVLLSVAGGVALSDFRDYTILVPAPDGRQDTRVFGSVSAVFPEISYAGFVPVMTLGIQDTKSNVSRFQRNEYSLNVGVRSSF